MKINLNGYYQHYHDLITPAGENLSNNHQAQFYSTSVPGVAVYGGFKVDF